MKIIWLSLFLTVIFGFGIFSFKNTDHQKTPKVAASSDTCFYFIRVPADLDVPSTPRYDTTVMSIQNCRIQSL